MPKIEKSSSTEEKVGEERLGSGDLLDGLGPTLIIGLIALAFILIVVIIIILVAWRIKKSPKCHERINKIKRALFFNPIIRFMVLNALKLDIQAFIAIKAADGDLQKAA